VTTAPQPLSGRFLRPRTLIVVDWVAGATAGVLMLALHAWLAEWYALPRSLLLVVAAANLGYAAVSFTLSRRADGERVPGLRVIAAANMGWGLVCFALAVWWFSSASVLGLVQLVGEGVLVGGLGVVEWVVVSREGA
jgi:hypothetical protein